MSQTVCAGLAITLRFVRERTLLSDLIDRGTGGFWKVGPRWSHVGAMFENGSDGLYEFGARSRVDRAPIGKPGVQYRPADYAKFAAVALVSIPASRNEYDAYWTLARRVRGAPYSHKTIEGFLTGENVPDDPRTIAFDCSTLQAWLLLHSSDRLMPPEFRGELRQISPNGLYDIARVIAFYRRGLASLNQGESR